MADNAFEWGGAQGEVRPDLGCHPAAVTSKQANAYRSAAERYLVHGRVSPSAGITGPGADWDLLQPLVGVLLGIPRGFPRVLGNYLSEAYHGYAIDSVDERLSRCDNGAECRLNGSPKGRVTGLFRPHPGIPLKGWLHEAPVMCLRTPPCRFGDHPDTDVLNKN